MAADEAIVQVVFQGRILETVKLDRNIIKVGRLPDNDVVINNLGVSRNHCRIIREETGNFYVEDLGSANGTIVNGIRVARSPLYNGDEVQIGKHKLIFQITSHGVAGFFKAEDDSNPDLWIGDRTVFTGKGKPAPVQSLPQSPAQQSVPKGEDTFPNFHAELEGKTFGIKVTLDGKVIAVKGLGEGNVTIGRDPGNDIVIDNLAASSRHAHILCHDKQYIVEDLGSANGIRVNGVSVRRSPLYPGDEILVGKHNLVFDSTDRLLATLDVADIEPLAQVTELTATPPVSTELPEKAAAETAPEKEEKKSPWEGKYSIRIELDGRTVATYALTKRVTCIGRLAENDIAIDNIGVSRLHAQIVIEEDDQVYIEDQDSANGIMVNGLSLKSSPLYPGDVVQIVKHKLVFGVSSKAQPEKAAAGGRMSTEAWRMDSTFMVTDEDRKRLLKEWAERAEREKIEKAAAPAAPSTKPAAEISPPVKSPPVRQEKTPEIPIEKATPEAKDEAPLSVQPQMPPPKQPAYSPSGQEPNAAGSFYERTPLVGIAFANAKLVFPGGSEMEITADVFTIGKNEDSNLKIAGMLIKKRHVIIKREGANIWSITDRGGLVRVKVNGQPVRNSYLKSGDKITLGSLHCTFLVY